MRRADLDMHRARAYHERVKGVIRFPRRYADSPGDWVVLSPLGFSVKAVGALMAVFILCGAFSARAQDQRKHKVPGLDKITNGPTEAIFSGKVQSLNMKDKVLNVISMEGEDTEIFPINKKTHVLTAEGGKLKLDSLTSGADVMVYYEQKGDRRQVKRIEVLEAGAAGAKKKSPPSS